MHEVKLFLVFRYLLLVLLVVIDQLRVYLLPDSELQCCHLPFDVFLSERM